MHAFASPCSQPEQHGEASAQALASSEAGRFPEFSSSRVDFRIPTSLQFRAEFFNLPNHANYNLIGRMVNDPTFGIVQNQLSPRQVQFAMRLAFNRIPA